MWNIGCKQGASPGGAELTLDPLDQMECLLPAASGRSANIRGVVEGKGIGGTNRYPRQGQLSEVIPTTMRVIRGDWNIAELTIQVPEAGKGPERCTRESEARSLPWRNGARLHLLALTNRRNHQVPDLLFAFAARCRRSCDSCWKTWAKAERSGPRCPVCLESSVRPKKCLQLHCCDADAVAAPQG